MAQGQKFHDVKSFLSDYCSCNRPSVLSHINGHAYLDEKNPFTASGSLIDLTVTDDNPRGIWFDNVHFIFGSPPPPFALDLKAASAVKEILLAWISSRDVIGIVVGYLDRMNSQWITHNYNFDYEANQVNGPSYNPIGHENDQWDLLPHVYGEKVSRMIKRPENKSKKAQNESRFGRMTIVTWD